MRPDNLEMTDFYCGCGGSSTGSVYAGVEVKSAANHWPIAIDTHSRNHPKTKHYKVDLLAVDPRLFPHTLMAWFSPECTTHSFGNGKKKIGQGQPDMFDEKPPDPDEERSRATMWDVVRFTEYHQYEVVVVENVCPIRYWPLLECWYASMCTMAIKLYTRQ